MTTDTTLVLTKTKFVRNILVALARVGDTDFSLLPGTAGALDCGFDVSMVQASWSLGREAGDLGQAVTLPAPLRFIPALGQCLELRHILWQLQDEAVHNAARLVTIDNHHLTLCSPKSVEASAADLLPERVYTNLARDFSRWLECPYHERRPALWPQMPAFTHEETAQRQSVRAAITAGSILASQLCTC